MTMTAVSAMSVSVTKEDEAHYWAKDLFEQYTKQKETVLQMRKEGKDKSLVNSMLAEIDEALVSLSRYCREYQTEEILKIERAQHGKKRKLFVMEDQHLSIHASYRSMEDEILNRICPEVEEDSVCKILHQVAKLPKRQREIIRMYADGMTYSDIAEICGIKKGSVSRSIMKVREKFAKYGIQMSLFDDF